MTAALPPSFAPSVVLMVGETGTRVHRHLASILGLTGPLGARTGAIALLQVDAVGAELWTRALVLGAPQPEAAEPAAGEFETAFASTARQVYDLPTRLAIEREGYAIAHDLQVLVVGGIHDPMVGETVHAARLTLAAIGQRATVCTLLEGDVSLAPLGRGRDAPRPVADLNLLFTDRIVHPAPAFVLDEDLRRGILAQALLALVATGIPLDSSFAQLLARGPDGGAVKLGSLRTCLVVFPRAAVERVCASRVGMEVVAVWRRTLLADVDAAGAAAERARALQALAAVRRCLDDSAMRPGSDPDLRPGRGRPDGGRARHRWPNLALPRSAGAGRDDSSRAYEHLVEASRRLFGPFAHAEVRRESREPGAPGWAAVSRIRGERAPDLGRAWRQAAQAAWAPLPSMLLAHVRELAGVRWAGGDRRLGLLRSFAEEADTQITALVAAFADLRARHHERYRRALGAYREMAGPWLAGPVEPGPVEADEPDDRLSEVEEGIARALGERAAARGKVAPPRRGIALAALLAFGAVTLPGLAILAPAAAGRWPAWAPQLLAAALAAAVLAAGATWLAARVRARRRERAAETDALRFWCLCYAYRCERVEDRLRVASLGPLRRWVQRTLHVVGDVEGYLAEVGACLEGSRRAAEADVFEGASGLLDVLVAEGGRLAAPGAPTGAGVVTFDDVVVAVKRRGDAAGRPEHLAEDFIGGFADAGDMLEMEPSDLGGRLCAFAGERLRDGLAPDVAADLHRALRDPGIQRLVTQVLESPLYDQRGTMLARQRYVCGRPPTDDLAGLPQGRLVLENQRDWWLLAALFAGAADPAVDGDLVGRSFPAGA